MYDQSNSQIAENRRKIVQAVAVVGSRAINIVREEVFEQVQNTCLRSKIAALVLHSDK